jgi:signal transduction histidine kinase
MVSVISLNKSISFQEIEEYLVAIVNGDHSSIRIPVDLKFVGGGAGIEAALTQLLITWARLNENGESEFHSYVRKDYYEKVLKKYCTTLYGLCAMYISPKITDDKHNEIKRYEALMPAKDLIDAMDKGKYENISKRRKEPGEKGGLSNIFLLSMLGARKQYIESLYTDSYDYKGNREVRTAKELTNELRQILKVIASVVPSNSLENTFSVDTIEVIDSEETYKRLNTFDVIGVIFHELIKNTEEHAKTDHRGNLYRKSISGVKVGCASLKEDDIYNLSKSYWKSDYLEFIKNYMKNIVCKSYIHVIEISIFDSGPGFIKRRLGKQFLGYEKLSFFEEQQILQGCLDKWGSTDPRRGKGLGLYNVSEAVQKLQGFISIRTGRSLISRGYYKNDHRDSPVDMDHELIPRAAVEGTVLTICIPILDSKLLKSYV